MILPDHQIRTRLADRSLTIDPIDDRAIGPCSIDLTLGGGLLWWPNWVTRDPRIDQSGLWRELTPRRWEPDAPVWILDPGIGYLATTAEEIRLPADLCGQLAARSSWGRQFLSVIQGPAGFLDAGYHGKPTLELSVIGAPLILWPGAPILQLVLYQLAAPACRPYGHRERASKYQGDRVPTASLAHREGA